MGAPSSSLHGIYAAVPTPLDCSGNLAVGDLRRIVQHLLSQRMHGLWVLGSGAEFACFSEEERGEILKVVTTEAGARLPVVASTAAAGTREARRAAVMAMQNGATAVFALPPYYYLCGESELERHFLTIADATPLPVVLYNNPWNTRSPIPAQLVRRLAQDRRFIGIKDSSGEANYFTELLRSAANETFAVMQGNELALGSAFLQGAAGAVIAFAGSCPTALP